MKIFIQIVSVLLGFFLGTELCHAEGQGNSNDPIATYQKNRQAFVTTQQNSTQSLKNQVAQAKQQIETIKQGNVNKNKELGSLNASIQNNENSVQTLSTLQQRASYILFPLYALVAEPLSLVNTKTAQKIAVAFLILTVINVFLYLYFKHKELFRRYKLLCIITVIVLISTIATPLFASDQTKREQVLSKLELVEKMLSKSEYEQFIAILEAKPSQKITLPSLQPGDPLFTVYQEVIIDTPEYWFTLAALYSHEKQNGKVLEAVKKITQESRIQSSEAHQKISINCIKYLLQEKQTQLVSLAADSLGSSSMSVASLLELATLLKQNGMQTSAEKSQSYAIAKANTVSDLVKLAQFFQNQEEIDKCNETLEKAIARVHTIDELITVAETALVVGKDSLVSKIAASAYTVPSSYPEKMKVVDLLIKSDRKEESVNLVSKMIKGDTSKTDENIKKLLYLIDASLKRNFIPQATDATETLIVILGLNRAKNFPVQTETKLKTIQGLPDEGAIMLPQFYGLIQEEQGFIDKAENAYIRSVLESLTAILASYGYNYPDSLNDFYLLGRVWVKGNQADLLGQLDRVYSSIEKQFLKNQETKANEELKKLNKEIEGLKKESETLQNSINTKKAHSTKVSVRLFFQSLSTIATIIFILGSIIGCLILAYRYCKKLNMGKTFGFAMKFLESIGWLQVFSVLGAIPGVGSIVSAQFFLIFQMIQENTFLSSGKKPLLGPTNQTQDASPPEIPTAK